MTALYELLRTDPHGEEATERIERGNARIRENPRLGWMLDHESLLLMADRLGGMHGAIVESPCVHVMDLHNAERMSRYAMEDAKRAHYRNVALLTIAKEHECQHPGECLINIYNMHKCAATMDYMINLRMPYKEHHEARVDMERTYIQDHFPEFIRFWEDAQLMEMNRQH